MVFFVFFFFKQKTVYEMRISDWSSDVCSSDLFGPYSCANVVVSTFCPILAAAYGAKLGSGRSAPLDEMLTIAPPSASRIWAPNNAHRRNTERRLIAMILSNRS